MRFVTKPDTDKTPKLADATTAITIEDIARNKRKSAISDSIYRDPYPGEYEQRSLVEDHLAKSYLNKCAYCERLEKADIEHYRPKKKVSGETHDGYYWLCYEWTNLLPACVKCNRDGAKHTKFPIFGTRVTQPSWLATGGLDFDKNKAQNSPLLDEIAGLLHPEIDRPENFFEFEIHEEGEGIKIIGIDTIGRGESTIETCKLNRQELCLARQRDVIDPFVEAITASLERLDLGEISNQDFVDEVEHEMRALKRNSQNPKKSHTFLRNYIIDNRNNFESIVLRYLTNRSRQVILNGFINIFE